MKFDQLLAKVSECRESTLLSRELIFSLTSARNPHGDTLLHIVAAEGNENAVAVLLKLGCDVNAQNNFGSSPLECAAWRELQGVVIRLLNAGADLTSEDSTGFTVVDNLRMMGKNGFVAWMLAYKPVGGEGSTA